MEQAKAAPGFKKGQTVIIFKSWDNKGTVHFRRCVVYSCGKVQMVLTDSVTGEEVGRHFSPREATGLEFGTRPDMTDEAAESLCLQLAADFLVKERARIEGCIKHYGYSESHAYTKAMRAKALELHEPRALNRTGAKGGV